MKAKNQFETVRHCPGSDAITQKVLRQIKLKSPEPQIANLFCGTGEQALLLAKEYRTVHITAVDTGDLYFPSIMGKAAQSGVKERIKTAITDYPLTKLPFEKESLDLILSEGAIDELDFCKRLNKWRPYIKPGGYLAMSELCLLKDGELPDELYGYFDSFYPLSEVKSIEYNLAQIREAGYKLHTRILLPDNCWIEYYKSMEEGMKELFGKDMEEEINFYLMYKEYIGYVYFVARKAPIISGESVNNTVLDKQQRMSLQNHLIDKLSSKECNNTLRYVESWLTDNIVRANHEAILEGFRQQDGYCDCEVLANVFYTVMVDKDSEEYFL